METHDDYNPENLNFSDYRGSLDSSTETDFDFTGKKNINSISPVC